MNHYETEKTLLYPPDLICNVLLDIEKYPVFLPWCKKSKILSHEEGRILAELEIAFSHLSESYVSEVSYYKTDDKNFVIDVKAVSGPFKILHNVWRINSCDFKTTTVQLKVAFEFESKILNLLFSVIFKQAVEKITDAFIKRIKTLAK